MCPPQDPHPPGGPLTPPAHPWQAECDALVAGLAHALSNRLSTLGAAAQTIEMGVSGVPMGGMLTAEVERLEEILRFLRELPAAPGEPPEPIHVPELVAEAFALHRHHRDYRDVGCRLDLHPSAEPVLQPRIALLHALLLMLSAAKKSARDAAHGSAEADIGLSAEGDGATVTLSTDAPLPDSSVLWASEDDALSIELARMLGLPAGAFAVERSEARGSRVRYRLRIPSLGALRRVEDVRR
ncbi:MAG: hypothetical protein M3068_04535 [Gemmatimonadota bacterium]|nr:hypothetical protein [Gemmatimonadota bacterium]